MNSIIQKIIGEGASGELGPVGFKAPPPAPPPGAPRTPVEKVTGAAPVHSDDEHREITIGHKILAAIDQMMPLTQRDRMVPHIRQLAQELIQMHGV